ncbi:hypothetical protein HTZ84_07140 [Haloterrigena sp. SYSU A558-1]|uniref:Uncharacterized protein n=1 Tax=Haloterrigena gelatinilytica TaxID=2741724 RepID=A0ABX2L737_9EURY|nr:hypothetical protein [Haloterrigena gelatinilytica]NUC72084.1 hypothetical protein [Haloterrigena gelatinilytica]
MGRDELEKFLRKKGAAELITEIGRGTATFKALVDAVSISSSTVSSRLSEGVEKDVYKVAHAPTEHGTEKRYGLTILGRRVYDWAENTEYVRKVRELRRVRHERDTAFEQMIGRVTRDMEILKMVTDLDPQHDLPPEMPEGASIVPKEPSKEERRKARDRRLEESLQPIEEVERNTETEDNEE